MKKYLYNKLAHLTMILCSVQYKHYNKGNKDIFYIEGTGKDKGKYLLYTERQQTADRMERF